MITWCVAQTKPSQETVAAKHLIEQGYDVYLPLFKKQRRHARKVTDVLYPLFPRYIFVGMDLDVARFRSIHSTLGISYLLMNGDRPATVQKAIIDDLKAQEITAGVVPINTIVPFSKGDKLIVLEGSLQDHIVTFESLDDKGRVQLLLNFLGREVKVSLSPNAVEAV